MLETEICIDRATPHHMVGGFKIGTRLHHTEGDRNAGVVENIGHNWRVSIARNGLIRMVEIRIVVVKTNWQPRQNACRQLHRVDTPLLAGVSVEKCRIQVWANKPQTLVAKRLWVGNALVTY